MVKRNDSESLELRSVERLPEVEGIDIVLLHTNAGAIDCRLHYDGVLASAAAAHPQIPDGGQAAIIWVGGAGGGLAGPGGGMYPRLASTLQQEGIGSLRLDYRRPNDLAACVQDTLLGAAYLQTLGYGRLILVGHSFGGAVVITAGAQKPATIGVICLASQNFGTDLAEDLSPRSLLLLHGESDRVLGDYCSREIYNRARQPKQLILYPGCGHGLDECRGEVDIDVLRWVRDLVGR
jgi:fermentation-respiration switch protein FrsA (DUF1100 family)